MGNENSTLIDDDTPPLTLEARDLKSVAKLIKDGHAKNIVVLTGAGISTAAGIPDFRSPETGLYHNLARLNLPHAEAVFDIDYFRTNPLPFYILAKELYPGKFHPTISHVFIALLAKRKLLRMLFTQNIDCLERAAGVPGSHIVEAHGSFATQRCIECKTEYPDKEMREHVEEGKPPKCIAGCGGLVKPDIVFFGEQLPATFYENRSVPMSSDLVLIIGTSLTVHPFASLPQMTPERNPRVLFNMERVGELGTQLDDVLCLGDCDSGIRKFADELGWRDELEKMWRDLVGEKEAERQLAQMQKPAAQRKAEWDETWDGGGAQKLAEAVETKLGLSQPPDSSIGANQAQVAVQNPAGSKEEREAKAESEATSKGVEAGLTISRQENSPPKSGHTDAASTSSDAATTKLDGVAGETDVEQSLEKATYNKPVVSDAAANEIAGDDKGDSSL